MSHYAKVLNGIVRQVIVAEADFFNTFVDTSPGEWIQTSYNTYGNIHYGQDGQPDGGVALRGNFAGVGYEYDDVNDVFIPPRPFSSWILSSQTFLWNAPTPAPQDNNPYMWNEDTLSWQLMSI